MKLENGIIEFSVSHPKLITVVMVLFTIAAGVFIPLIKVDTDPENMLSEDEVVRVFHNQSKKQFDLSDIVVVGIINEKNPNGVFNPDSLKNIYELTEYSKTLVWPDEKDPQKQIGVVEVDILAPSTVDFIGQGGPGVVKFEWLMSKPPTTQDAALEIRDKALSNPLLKGTVVSEDGKAICIYLPLTKKDLCHRIYTELRKKIATLPGDDSYYITGLPVAEDTFGHEMFIQMAISAPLTMLAIFILMLIFFKKFILVISPMVIAMVSTISTMGMLIGFGYPVHIMSSMIPIFLMPIAIVDSVHILSEFFECYTKEKGKKAAITEVMHNLFVSMLYTSLTSAAGFGSLVLTPIPPVQVFGIFVALGIMIAWVFTVTFVPAYVMFIKDKSLENFGHAAIHGEKQTWLTKSLHLCGRFTFNNAKPILVAMLLLLGVAFYGITQININDNPVKWFSKTHPIRQADIKLNEHFGGTYMAYLVLDQVDQNDLSDSYLQSICIRMDAKSAELKTDLPQIQTLFSQARAGIAKIAAKSTTKEDFLGKMADFAEQSAAADHNSWEANDELTSFFELEKERLNIFKQPEVLRYIADMQKYLDETGSVGKSSSVSDVVRKVNQELTDGKPASYIIPQSMPAIAECLLQFQNSHSPQDLWHLVTQDCRHANIWLQLKSGDNKDMSRVVKAVDDFMKKNPPPVPLKRNWAGLTYINLEWQNKMVIGMLQSFLGSFIIVFIMMAILFRSVLWGLVCMVPLTISIAAIYGIIGFIGKDYDMPIAVLSSLTLGMAVDFAIHFLERSRTAYAQLGSWKAALPEMFSEPARAISRNVLVVAIGFLPLFAAPLNPYKTVSILLCSIMAFSGIITLFVLPAIFRLFEKRLFKVLSEQIPLTCNCIFCIVISVSTVILVAVNLHQFAIVSPTKLIWISVIAVIVLIISCTMITKHRYCKTQKETKNNERQV